MITPVKSIHVEPTFIPEINVHSVEFNATHYIQYEPNFISPNTWCMSIFTAFCALQITWAVISIYIDYVCFYNLKL